MAKRQELTQSMRSDCAFEEVANKAGCGKCENPCPHNTLYYCPPNTGETFYCADAHDRRGNDVSGRQRNAVIARDLNDERGSGFSGKAVYRLQSHHSMAQGAKEVATTPTPPAPPPHIRA